MYVWSGGDMPGQFAPPDSRDLGNRNYDVPGFFVFVPFIPECDESNE